GCDGLWDVHGVRWNFGRVVDVQLGRKPLGLPRWGDLVLGRRFLGRRSRLERLGLAGFSLGSWCVGFHEDLFPRTLP
ncbi:MAG: hypothetical protein Q8M16_08540, partial [Pirellulaceae bacterium]|nr:hypothetical protein [Pirellulaceae bacterium]